MYTPVVEGVVSLAVAIGGKSRAKPRKRVGYDRRIRSCPISMWDVLTVRVDHM